jgi:hypothetical protein
MARVPNDGEFFFSGDQAPELRGGSQEASS